MKYKQLIFFILITTAHSNAFAETLSFGEGCLIKDEETQLTMILQAKRDLLSKVEELDLNWRSLGIMSVNVGASKNCPSITVALDSEVAIEKLRGKIGNFYKTFPVTYEVQDEIIAL